MAKAATCLWFAPEDAPKAIDLYTSLIPNSRVVANQTFANDQQASGQVQLWTLELAGKEIHVLGSDGNQPFNMAHSMWLVVADQTELNRVWDGFLAAGGKELACGWIADPFGVQWQVIPEAWERYTTGADRDQAQRVAEALWQMTRIDVAQLEAAARG